MSFIPSDDTGLTRVEADGLYAPLGGVLGAAESDARYVDVNGDTMTGALESSAALAVTVGSTASGAFRAMAGGISALGDIQATAGRMYVGSGSAGAPGFSFTGNTNAGVNRAAANHVTLNGGGVVCLGARYASAGNLGGYTPGNFGAGLTDYPSVDRFHASQSSAAASMFWGVNGTSGGTARIGLQTNAGSAYHVADNGTAGWNWGLRQSDAAFVLGAGSGVPSTSHLSVTQAGAVSVDTESYTVSNVLNTGNAIVGSCPTSSRWTIRGYRMNNMVHLCIWSTDFTMGVTSTLTLATVLPAALRPSALIQIPSTIKNAGVLQSSIVGVSSAGTVILYAPVGLGAFSSGITYAVYSSIIYPADIPM